MKSPRNGFALSTACSQKPKIQLSFFASIILICTSRLVCACWDFVCCICVQRTQALKPLSSTASRIWSSLPIRCASARCASAPDDASRLSSRRNGAGRRGALPDRDGRRADCAPASAHIALPAASRVNAAKTAHRDKRTYQPIDYASAYSNQVAIAPRAFARDRVAGVTIIVGLKVISAAHMRKLRQIARRVCSISHQRPNR